MKNHQLRASELAMRIYEITRTHAVRHPNFMMCEIVEQIVRLYGTSSSTAFRYVRTAVDVLCINYDHSERLRRKA